MSRVCLFVLSLILGIAVQFGDSYVTETDKNKDCSPSKAGSDKTHLSPFEKIPFKLSAANHPTKNFDSFFKKNNKKSSESDSEEKSDLLSGSFKEFLEKINKLNSNFPIFPGTKWCGNGDTASSESDLGRFNDTDACCRAHDNCKSDILAGKTLANLINNGLFTRSACTCDHAFYTCLKKVDSIPSKTIGKLYFDVLGPQCFECTCPTADCQTETDPNCDNHCTKYKWLDNPEF